MHHGNLKVNSFEFASREDLHVCVPNFHAAATRKRVGVSSAKWTDFDFVGFVFWGVLEVAPFRENGKGKIVQELASFVTVPRVHYGSC